MLRMFWLNITKVYVTICNSLLELPCRILFGSCELIAVTLYTISKTVHEFIAKHKVNQTCKSGGQRLSIHSEMKEI